MLAILMVKLPGRDRVKTRLTADGRLTAEDAASIARAMIRCTAVRLARRFELVAAVSPDGAGAEVRALLTPGMELRVVDQGPGTLGDRLARLWRDLAADRPVAFFGMDSPDVPDPGLQAVVEAIEVADAAIGPTPDGGFWTLAARVCRPQVLVGIDWGSASVYDQACGRMDQAGWRYRVLPLWDDVDRPDDIQQLRDRIADHADPELAQLAASLDEILGSPGRVPPEMRLERR